LVAITESADGLAGQIGMGTTHHVALAVASFDALLKWKRWHWGLDGGRPRTVITAEV
jgi:hypothetical protein